MLFKAKSEVQNKTDGSGRKDRSEREDKKSSNSIISAFKKVDMNNIGAIGSVDDTLSAMDAYENLDAKSSISLAKSGEKTPRVTETKISK